VSERALSDATTPGFEYRPLWRSKALRRAALVSGLGLGGLGFAPQFGGPGYEAALAAGVVLPTSAAIAVALETLAARPRPIAAFERGVHVGFALAALALLLSLLHGLRVGLCDPGEGLALFLLGPSFGAVLGGVSGAAAGLVAERSGWRPRRRVALALALALAGPLLGIVVSLVRFYTSPMVFAYDPYFGFFSGPLYDTVIGSLWPLASYRLGTTATLLAALVLALLLEREPGGSLRLRRRFDLLFGALLAALVSGAVTLFGPELGHFSTTSSIEAALGRELAYGRCDVVHSSAITPIDARRLARDCDAHLRQLGRFFGAAGPERVRVFLFANDQEKGRLMGASRTYIAKPWRREVYLQSSVYPHPVLAHELAHVVAGSFARGPFHVAGPLGGWIPDPGRIEGVAVAAAPDDNDELTLEEWAAAQLRIGVLPSFESLFKLSFLGQPASRAYTAAGAFVRFVHARFGAEALRRWYAGEDLERVTGRSLQQLDGEYRARLMHLPVSENVLNSARARFDRPSFFERRCPRVIDRLATDAAARLALGDVHGAREAYREVLALDPRDANARIGLGACDARGGELEAARRTYRALSEDALAPVWARLLALEAKGDLFLRSGDLASAQAVYTELAAKVADADRLRTLDVKRRAGPGLAREAIVMLLIGDELGPSWDVAAAKLGEWAAFDPSAGIADYLLGRNLVLRGRPRQGAQYLDRALSRAIPDQSVLDETLRLRLIAACALSDPPSARPIRDRLLTRTPSKARREALARFSERCGL
jgi:tetratricopeptide (TPR) repeat protein